VISFLFCVTLGTLVNAFEAWRDDAAEQAEIKAKTMRVLKRMLNGDIDKHSLLLNSILYNFVQEH